MANNFRYNREHWGRLSRWPLPVMMTELQEISKGLVISNLYRDEAVELTVHMSKHNIVYSVTHQACYEIWIDFEQIKNKNKTISFIEVLIYFIEMLCGNKIEYKKGDEVLVSFDSEHYRIKNVTCPNTEQARISIILQLLSFINEALQKDLD